MPALDLCREAGDRRNEAATLNHIDVGDRQRALAAFQQAVFIRREVGNHRGEATT